MDPPTIPFSGSDTGNQDPNKMASFIRPEDKLPLTLALSLYGSPIPTLQTYEMVDNSYKVRFAAWIDKSTRILIVGCRGTSVGKKDAGQDLKDDKVSFYFLSFSSTFCNLVQTSMRIA